MTQSEALDILKMGENVYLSGPAGSGKTHVLNAYVEYLKSHAVDVAVTASTGIAATHLGGMTIHSWSGLGVRNTLTDYDVDELMEQGYDKVPIAYILGVQRNPNVSRARVTLN